MNINYAIDRTGRFVACVGNLVLEDASNMRAPLALVPEAAFNALLKLGNGTVDASPIAQEEFKHVFASCPACAFVCEPVDTIA